MMVTAVVITDLCDMCQYLSHNTMTTKFLHSVSIVFERERERKGCFFYCVDVATLTALVIHSHRIQIVILHYLQIKQTILFVFVIFVL